MHEKWSSHFQGMHSDKETLVWESESGNYFEEYYEWDITEPWRLASKQFGYFSDPNNGYINGEVITITSVEEISKVLASEDIQKESVVMNRNLIKYIIFLSIILLVSYYIVILYNTHEIMIDFKKIINDEDGGCNVKNDKLLVFRPREDDKVVILFRYFTWCYKDKGKIWLYRKEEHILNGKIYKVPDFFSVNIEKKDSEWMVTSINIVP